MQGKKNRLKKPLVTTTYALTISNRITHFDFKNILDGIIRKHTLQSILNDYFHKIYPYEEL